MHVSAHSHTAFQPQSSPITPNQASNIHTQVIIVGAGPSGLVLSLLLAQAGIRVTLLDSGSTIDSSPRAAHYAPSAIQILQRAGVLEDVRRDGFIPGDMSWRQIDGSPIVTVKDVAQRHNPDAMTVLPLNLLGKVLLRHAEKNEMIAIRWDCEVVGVEQGEKEAWAVVRAPGGDESKVAGDYVVGCDGGNSTVRKALFGGDFPGKTWDAQIVATNVRTYLQSLPADYSTHTGILPL